MIIIRLWAPTTAISTVTRPQNVTMTVWSMVKSRALFVSWYYQMHQRNRTEQLAQRSNLMLNSSYVLCTSQLICKDTLTEWKTAAHPRF